MSTTQNTRKYTQRINKPTNDQQSTDQSTKHQQYRSKTNTIQPNSNYSPKQSPKRYIKRGQRNAYHHIPYDDQLPTDYPPPTYYTYRTPPMISKPDEYQLPNDMEIEINKSLPPGLYHKQPQQIIKEYRNQYHPNQTNNSERNPNWRTKQPSSKTTDNPQNNSNRNTNNTSNTSNTSNTNNSRNKNNHRFERIHDEQPTTDNPQKFYYQPRTIPNITHDPLVMIGELKQSSNYTSPVMYEHSGSTHSTVQSPSSSSSTAPVIISPKISSPDVTSYHRTSKNNGDDQIQTQSVIEQSASDLYEIVYVLTGKKPDIALPVIKHCLSNISKDVEMENIVVDELKPKYTPEWLLAVAKNYVGIKESFNLPKSVTFIHSISEAGRKWQENNSRRRFNPQTKRFARTHSPSTTTQTVTNDTSNDMTDNSSWRKVINDGNTDKITDDDINDILHIKQLNINTHQSIQRMTSDEIEKQLKYEQHHQQYTYDDDDDAEYQVRVLTPELKPNPAEMNVNDNKTPEWMKNTTDMAQKDFQFIILDKERDKKHMKEHGGQLPINSTFVTEDEYHRRIKNKMHDEQIQSHAQPTQEILIVTAQGIEKDSKENALLQLKIHQRKRLAVDGENDECEGENEKEGQLQQQPPPQQSSSKVAEGVPVWTPHVNDYPPQIRGTMIRLEQDIQKISNYLRVAPQWDPGHKARYNKHLTKLMMRKQEYIEWWRIQQITQHKNRHSPAVVSVVEGGGTNTAVVYGSNHHSSSDTSKTRQIRSLLALKKAASLEQVDHFEKYYRKQLIKMQQQAKTDPTKYSNYVEYYNRKLKTVEKRRWELKNYLRMNEIRKKGQLVLQTQGKDAYQKYVAQHLKEFDVGGHGHHSSYYNYSNNGKQLVADISHNTSPLVNNSSTILNVMDNMLKNKNENTDVQGCSQNTEIYLTPAVNDQRNTSAFWDLPAGYTKVQQKQRKQSSEVIDEQLQPMINNKSDYDGYMGISNAHHSTVVRNAILTSQTSVGSTHGVGTLGKKLEEAQMNAMKEKKRAEKLKAHIRKHALKYVSNPPPIEDQNATRVWYQNLKKVENIILEKYTRKIHKANQKTREQGENAHLMQQQRIIHNTHIAQHSPQMRVQTNIHSPRRVIYMNNSGGNRSPHTLQQQSPSHMMRYDQNGNPVPVTVAIPMTSAVPVSTSSPSGVSPSMMHVMYQQQQHSPSNEYGMRAVGAHAYGIPSPPMTGNYYTSNPRSPQQHVLVNPQMSPRLHSGSGSSPSYYTHHMNVDGMNAGGGSVGAYYPSSPPTHSPTGYTTHQLSRGQSPRYT